MIRIGMKVSHIEHGGVGTVVRRLIPKSWMGLLYLETWSVRVKWDERPWISMGHGFVGIKEEYMEVTDHHFANLQRIK
jgi:hypothetical protein